MPNIIKQDGSPVSDEPDPERDAEYDFVEAPETLVDAAKEFSQGIAEGLQGVKKFRDGFLFKVGVIAVAIKALDVVGKIILEDRRMKSEERRQQDEK